MKAEKRDHSIKRKHGRDVGMGWGAVNRFMWLKQQIHIKGIHGRTTLWKIRLKIVKPLSLVFPSPVSI